MTDRTNETEVCPICMNDPKRRPFCSRCGDTPADSDERILLNDALNLLRAFREDTFERGELSGRSQRAGEDLIRRIDAFLASPLHTKCEHCGIPLPLIPGVAHFSGCPKSPFYEPDETKAPLTYSGACKLLADYAIALHDRQCCGDSFQPQYIAALKACTDAMGVSPALDEVVRLSEDAGLYDDNSPAEAPIHTCETRSYCEACDADAANEQ